MADDNRPVVLSFGKGWEELNTYFKVVSISDLDNSPELDHIEGVILYKVLIDHPLFSTHLLDSMPKLKVVSTRGVGLDFVQPYVDNLKGRGIYVAYNTGEKVMCKAVADVCMCLLMSVMRGVQRGVEFARSSQATDAVDWVPWKQSMLDTTHPVTGATLGIIGLGRIGYQVAKRARHGFSMNVLYHGRTQKPEESSVDATFYSSLDCMLPLCDCVAVCCPLTPHTAKMIGAEQFKLMKKTAVIVNIARGGIIDTDALVRALEEGEIFGAGLDVTEPEPLPPDHPLLHMDNVMVTPHMAYSVKEVTAELEESITDNLKRVLIDRLPPKHFL